MWWKWISTASAGQGLATVPRVLPHTQHPHLLQKSYQSKNTKKEVANCPAFTHFLLFPSKGWEYSLSYSGFTAIRLWLLTITSRDLLGGTCLLEWEQWELQRPLWNLTGGILPMSLSSYCIPQRQVSAHLTIADMFFTMRPPGSTFSVPLEL